VPEQRLKSLATLVALVLVGVIVTGALVGAGTVGDDLQRKAEQALSAAELDDVRVSVEGREATLSGGTPDELDRAELVVEGVHGIRWAEIAPADDGAAADEPDTVPTLTLRRSPGGLTIDGTVPDADAAADIKVGAAEAFGVPVTGDLAIDAGVGRATWVDRLPDVFGDVAAVGDLTLTIDGSGTLDLSGTIDDRFAADRIRDLVASAVPDLQVLTRLHVLTTGVAVVDGGVPKRA
jgi:hypothetical protein